MPFIINHVDTLFTMAEVTVKVLKFAAKVMHYAALLIGAALILTGYWLVNVVNHFTGKTQTMTDTVAAEHGPVLTEYAPAPTIAPESYVAVVPAIYSLDFANEWVLEDGTAPIAPTKPARKRRTSRKKASVAA